MDWLKTQLKTIAAIAGILIIGITICGGVAALAVSIYGIKSVEVKIVGAVLIVPILLTFLGAIASITIIHDNYLSKSKDKNANRLVQQTPTRRHG